MTVDELLALAKKVDASFPALGTVLLPRMLRHEEAADVKVLCAAVRELLGVSHPCGYDEPIVAACGTGRLIVAYGGNGYEPDEARGIAIGLLRTADEAEAGK